MIILIAGALAATLQAAPPGASDRSAEMFDARRADWRTGAVTYQIFVDRFAPSRRLEDKRGLYAAPRTLQSWDAQPSQGEPAPGTGVWTHELAFWGGDLDSVASRADYLEALGVEAVYLNPIFAAPTNHKYDMQDFFAISPEYGDAADLSALGEALDARGMALILDGVFNHVGRRHPAFVEAQADPQSEHRGWFVFDESVQNGYVGWWGAGNLPELDWENPAVRAHFAGEDGVIRHWFDYGIDGWRLDVATEIGLEHLQAVTAAAHAERPGALVLGEVWSWPESWTGVLDAVMNFPLREMLFAYSEERMSGPVFADALDAMLEDAGTEPILRSWLLLDNHDTARLATLYPDPVDRAFLQTLQLTLPGAPLVYYGTEAGLEGGEDPGGRGPMDWARAQAGFEAYDRLAALIALREAHPALKIGDVRTLASDRLLAFLRVTDRSAETVLVVANNGAEPVTETLAVREGWLMTGDVFVDALTGERFESRSSLVTVTVPPRTVRVLAPDRWREHTRRTGHDPYDGVP